MEQADSGAGLAAQRDAIEREAAHRGWESLGWYSDGGWSGKDLDRPEMATAALGDPARRPARDGEGRSALAVRWSTSPPWWSGRSVMGWSIVTLDLGLDLSTAQGEFVASILAAFARMERRLIGQRTRDAMAAEEAGRRRSGTAIGPARARRCRRRWRGWSPRARRCPR